ncbi:MAG TPA: hypothetical protein VK766_00315 [Cytophagaceae bacterium]|nr:hypothetical protein [Cytophagaceae bacterium]
MKSIVYLFALLLSFTFFSCKRASEVITTNPNDKLTFSQSVVIFDTMFSTVGSITQRLWVYNQNKHALNISKINLAHLYNSSYKITIDGEEVVEFDNYEIYGKDSMLILIKVLIDPQNKSLPYLVEDSIVFTTNGNNQFVGLSAYGQDAFFFTNTTTACNTIWNNTKPYVIIGNLTVPAGCTLTVNQGTKICFHQNATLTVAGTILVNGVKDSAVTFLQDNLSGSYATVAGQWGGIIIQSGSKNNWMSYSIIKNATNAITMLPEPDGDTIPELTLQNTFVLNSSQNLIQVSNTDFYAVNSLINNTPGYLFKASSGGNYYFDFCTLTDYSNDFFRQNNAVRLSNQDSLGSNALVAKLRNTIIWGDQTDEITINNNGSSGFTFVADYAILKSTLTIAGTSSLFNQDPMFTNVGSKIFTLQTGSPAINSGMIIPSITIDITGKTRDANPDRGCYEK